jgi:hypothetical protein
MPNTYVALRTETLAVATNTITFNLTGISGYTDLVLVMNALQTSPSVNQTRIRVGNSSIDSGSNYSQTILYGNGTSALSTRASNQSFIDFDYMGAPGISGNPNIIVANFMNYSNTTTNKTILHRSGQTTTGTDAIVSLWRSTAAINLINVFTSSGNNWTVGTTFNLYGIANADQGAAKATGGIITEDSTYWYHTFGASGAFIPKQSLSCDVLVVAGGGGGGRRHGGGGGAGGVSYQSGRSVTATTYNITVGGGGAGGGAASPGATASNSVFDTITSNGGGGGGGGNNVGLNGGSGGGGSGFSIYVTPGTATQGNTGGATGYGFNGGTAFGSANNVGGGGGGSSETPAAATNTVAGNGGAGLNTWSSWTVPTGTGVNGFFAGGGGGAAFQAVTTPQGTGGSGGGGAGSHSGIATAGVTNTGSGGGGQGNDSAASGAGGSGIVIIRYSK